MGALKKENSIFFTFLYGCFFIIAIHYFLCTLNVRFSIGVLHLGHLFQAQDLELTQQLEDTPAPAPSIQLPNGRQEVLIGQDAPASDTKVKTTAIVENHRSLSVSDDPASRSVEHAFLYLKC